jgi:hypothetical protein
MRNRVRTALLVAAVLSLGSAAPCRAASHVDLTPKWKQGERLEYLLVKTRRKTRGGATQSDETTRTPVTVEVLEAGSSGFLLAWTLGETRFDNPDLAANPVARAVVNAVKGQRILVEVDAGGTPTGVRNWEEIKAFYGRFIELVSVEFKKLSADPKLADTVRSALEPLFSSRESIESMSLREPWMLLLPVGWTLSSEEPAEYEDLLQSPLGGEPIPSKARLTLVRLDAASSTAVVAFTQSVDPKAAKQNLEAAVRGLGDRMGKPVPADERFGEIRIADAGEYVVDTRSRWVVRFTFSRTVAVDDIVQTETITMQRQGTRER